MAMKSCLRSTYGVVAVRYIIGIKAIITGYSVHSLPRRLCKTLDEATNPLRWMQSASYRTNQDELSGGRAVYIIASALSLCYNLCTCTYNAIFALYFFRHIQNEEENDLPSLGIKNSRV